MPGYATVNAIVRGIDPGLAVLAHEGIKRYKELFDLVYRRQAERPNAHARAGWATGPDSS